MAAESSSRPGTAGACVEREITDPVDLCLEGGRLNPDAIGWSRQPIHNTRIGGRWGRRKRWDYWCITSSECALALTFANVDYLGIADIWFFDRSTREVVAKSVAMPLALGFEHRRQEDGRLMRFEGDSFLLEIEETSKSTRMRAKFDSAKQSFEADLIVAKPAGHESLSVVIPWSSTHFQYTTKDNTRPAVGTITTGSREYQLGGDDAWACLDLGRGKWPYSMTWNWGSASGLAGAHLLGIQLGGKWTAGTGMTENAICVDGKISKLSEELTWEYDTANWLAPWYISTPESERVRLTFKPDYDKTSRIEALVASSSVHQCFGLYSGTVIDDDGVSIEVDDLFGWAEEARWRW